MAANRVRSIVRPASFLERASLKRDLLAVEYRRGAVPFKCRSFSPSKADMNVEIHRDSLDMLARGDFDSEAA